MDILVKLESLIDSKEGQPFVYGKNDCTILACQVIACHTGVDPSLPYLDRYTTFLGGVRHLRTDGFQDHIDFIRSFCDPEPIDVAFSQVGDLAIVHEDNMDIWAVVCGPFLIALTQNGLTRLDLNRSVTIYKVSADEEVLEAI